MVEKVAILGWYGHRNIGDEAMLEGLRFLFQGWTIYPMTDNPDQLVPQFNIDLVNDCDLFVLGGGELINSNRLFMNPPHWSRAIKIPKVILGCGVNVESPSYLAPHVLEDLEKFDYIGVRDSTAYRILDATDRFQDKLGLFFDPSIALAIKYRDQITKDMENRAIVIPTDRSTSKYDEGIRELDIARTSVNWLKQNLANDFDEITFLPFGNEDNNDLETCQKLIERLQLNGTNVIQPASFLEAARLSSRSRLAISYRLHGLILCIMTGTKYVYYPYHRKLTRIYETLKQYKPTQVVEELLKQWMTFCRHQHLS